MDQRHVLLSALTVGVGVGVGLKLAHKCPAGAADSGDSLSADRITHELTKQLLNGKDDKITLEEFPYFLGEKTKTLLINSSYVHLKFSDFSKHTRNLAAASRTIMLTGAAELYHLMLARALAHHFESTLLLLDTNDFSIKMQSKYGYVRKPPTMKRSISEATLAQVSNLFGSFSILPSKEESPSTDSRASGVNGEHHKHRRTSSAVTESTQRVCSAPRKQSIGWGFNEKIFLQSLYKVLMAASEKNSVILYLRDAEKFVLQSPKTYSLFSKFLGKLSGPILVLTSMIPNHGDEVAKERIAELFPYCIEIKPPEDESSLTKWKTQLEEDMKTLQLQDNRNHVQQILAANDIQCDDLSSICLPDSLSTAKCIDEAVLSAISYHLANTKDPEYRNGKLIISAKSLSHGFGLMGDGKNKVTKAESLEDEVVNPKKESESKIETEKATKEGEIQPPAKTVEPDNEFEKRIRQEVIPAKEIGVTFADIGSMEEIKESLQELVMLPLRRPDLFTGGLLKPCRGILLFGPPGTGKTMLGKAIAKEAGASFINVSMSTITSKWFGEDEKNVRALFTLAAKVSPTIIFVDEVDSMLGQRTRVGEHEAMRKIKNEFMTHWDGLMTKPGERILVLAATNRPFDLDEAIIRRFERRIMVGLPSSESREKILRTLLTKEKTEDLDFKVLATMTEGYSGSDLKNLCVTAAYRPLRELIEKERLARKSESEEASAEKPSEVVLRALTMEDMRHAKNQVAASFASEGSIMQELKQWNDSYGEGGSRKKQQLSYFL